MPRDMVSLASLVKEAFLKEPHAPGVWQGSRRLTKGRPGKRIVMFASRKNGCMMPCESRLEADNCLRLEFDEQVHQYRTQPFTIQMRGGLTYTPDSVQLLRSGEVVVTEVKFSGALQNPDLRDKLQWLRDYFYARGATFSVRTEESLRQKPLLANRRFIYRASHIPVTEHSWGRATELLQSFENGTRLRDFRSACLGAQLPPLMPEKLLLLHQAGYQEHEILNEHSQIWARQEDK